MIRLLREFRLLPVVLVAAACLLALKTLGLVLDGGYILASADDGSSATVPTVIDPAAAKDGSAVAKAEMPDKAAALSMTAPVVVARTSTPANEKSWAQAMFNFPDVTGSIAADKPAPAVEHAGEREKPASPAKAVSAKPAPATPPKPVDAANVRSISPGERAILERLQERRKELDARARQLDMREMLIKAAEKRLEAKAAEVKQIETHIETAKTKQDETQAERLKSLIAMYETMKPKDAAKIFDRLDMKVLVDVASRIKPRQMAEIMAQMSPQIAERLTVEFASREPARNRDISSLPKIEGQPTAAN